jgi:hypothetical protein
MSGDTRKSRTIDDILAGVPRTSKPATVNWSNETAINPKTGRLVAPRAKTGQKRPGVGKASHFKRIWNPDHPDFDPRVTERHLQKMKEAGLKKRGRALPPAGIGSARWFPEFARRFEEAKKFMEELSNHPVLRQEMIPLDIDEQTAVKEALALNLAVVRSPELSIQLRVTSSKVILDFCKAKPVARSAVTVETAEQWLGKLASEVEADKNTLDGQYEVVK